ncbi:hypothetical protein NC661_02035 [Aquibacillus koreensis]|uniref:SPOR domain-containing protein n=1 Tax=Aquibacillus koreensis TaxID=279446 RepID=A0A9X3WHP2_9BACI|nr:hypothetical protein [Aquibacillus koreensis]MDC3419158.1 hypothetical protein [Aquibacillus koreensis]
MDKQTKISVRMNGKETTIQDNKTTKQDPWPNAYQQQAAALDNKYDPDDLIEFEKNHSSDDQADDWYKNINVRKKQKKIPPVVKVFAVSAVSAILVGVTIGFIMLGMFVGIDNGGEAVNGVASVPADGDTSTAAPDTENSPVTGDATETVTYSAQPLSAIFVQGGAYSSVESAEAAQQGFLSSGYPAVVWEKDGWHRVIMHVSNSQATVDQQISSFQSEGLETIDKAWTTEQTDVQLPSSEAEWLESFPKLWTTAITGEITIESWDEWVSSYPEDSSTTVQALQAEAKGLIEAINSDQSTQSSLLKMWKLYADIGKE